MTSYLVSPNSNDSLDFNADFNVNNARGMASNIRLHHSDNIDSLNYLGERVSLPGLTTVMNYTVVN